MTNDLSKEELIDLIREDIELLKNRSFLNLVTIEWVEYYGFEEEIIKILEKRLLNLLNN